MKSLKKSLFLAFMFLGSFTSPYARGEEQSSSLSFESRLQRLSLESQETERLHHLFALHWEWMMFENPCLATIEGVSSQNHRWHDLSLEAINRQNSFSRDMLNVINSIDAQQLDERDKLNYTLFKKSLEESLEASTYPTHYLALNQKGGVQLYAPMIIEAMPAETVEDYENILSRLNDLPLLVDQTIELLKLGIKEGVTSPKITLIHVPEQILNQIVTNPLDSSFLKAFKSFPTSLNENAQNGLLEKGIAAYQNKVVPAFYKLYSYLTEEYLPSARQTTAFSDLPKGSEWYAFQVRQMTTTDLSPWEIHAIGQKEVQRIHHEMQKVIKDLGFQGNLDAFFQFLRTDPQFYYRDRDSLFMGYKQLTKHIEDQLPLLFMNFPKLPFEMAPVPPYCEESEGTAYYMPGSKKNQRPGYFYINLSHPEARPKWEMEALALHEAVPGHHFQLSLAQEIEDLPDFRRVMDYTAFVEGWGLYSESLGYELGLYLDPYSQFGRLSLEMMRAVRLVVDTGMHAMGWTRQQGIDYFKQYVPLSDHEIMSEIDRYIAMPAQALSYKIGELKLQELRRLATEKLGQNFDIRAFHHELLKQGTVPLDVVEQHIHQWIKQEQAEIEMELREPLVVFS